MGEFASQAIIQARTRARARTKTRVGQSPQAASRFIFAERDAEERIEIHVCDRKDPFLSLTHLPAATFASCPHAYRRACFQPDARSDLQINKVMTAHVVPLPRTLGASCRCLAATHPIFPISLMCFLSAGPLVPGDRNFSRFANPLKYFYPILVPISWVC